MRRGELINYNGSLYIVKRVFNEDAIKADKTNELRELLMCDITLKSQGKLLFCEKINEAEIVNE